jgi:hypothetical protein
MKNENINGITRRSFIKRSTVAAIAASNLMMFTGLVNAANISPSPLPEGDEEMATCEMITELVDYNESNNESVYSCYWQNNMVLPCSSVGQCLVNSIIPGEYIPVDVYCVINNAENPIICNKLIVN